MKNWRCTVCDYVHTGSEPPAVCPVCGAGPEAFELMEPGAEPAGRPSAQPIVPGEEAGGDVAAALRSLTYGMFVVSSRSGDRLNAQTCNTVFQVTSDPVRLAIGINQRNLTHEFMTESAVAAITVLGQGNMGAIKHFGFRSGRDGDKLAGVDHRLSPVVGCPILPAGSYYLEGRVLPELSPALGTHTLFILEVLGGGPLRRRRPLTYGDYRLNRSRPEAAVDDVDGSHVVAALNLEYGATRRYQEQLSMLSHPALISILEGILRTEQDHVEAALDYLKHRAGAANGFATALLHMRLNREFEQVARDTYARFAAEVDDPQLQSVFTKQARSETGHINIFNALVKAMEDGSFPVAFFCTLCGWPLEFGPQPSPGAEIACEKCGARFRLTLFEGDWGLLPLT